jgi:hypothetical protein
MGGRSGDLARARAERHERLVVVVGAACASAGSARAGRARAAGGCGRRGVRDCGQCARRRACAVNNIEDEGAVALAAVLQGNTTLQTLNLRCMWTARTRAFAGKGGPLPGPSRGRGRRGASGWWLWLLRRARVRAVSTAWCVVQGTASETMALLRWRRRSKATCRCRRSTSPVRGPLAACIGVSRQPLREPLVRERGGASCFWLWSARRARVRAVSTAWGVCRERHPS